MTLYAFTNIKGGYDDGDKHVKYVFTPGQEVTGIPRDHLESLAKAGALAKYDRMTVDDKTPVSESDLEETAPTRGAGGLIGKETGDPAGEAGARAGLKSTQILNPDAELQAGQKQHDERMARADDPSGDDAKGSESTTTADVSKQTDPKDGK